MKESMAFEAYQEVETTVFALLSIRMEQYFEKNEQPAAQQIAQLALQLNSVSTNVRTNPNWIQAI